MKKNNYKNASLRKKVLARRLNKHYKAYISLNILCLMSLDSIRNAFNPLLVPDVFVPDAFSEKETQKQEGASFISWDDINKYEKQIEELFKINNKID